MGNVVLPKWLKELPLAPEFRPTDTEFADPIAYISKIEKEVGAFGICKVIPPLSKPSKRYVFDKLNKTLLRTRELGLDVNLKETVDSSMRVNQDKKHEVENRAVFTTRQQELGKDAKRGKGGVDMSQPAAQKQVWQSGELYTLEQFESKSKAFSRSVLGSVKEVTPLTIEALFWKAASEKPIYIEYANDVPGSGFGEPEGFSGHFRACNKRKRMCGPSPGGRSYLRQQGVNKEAIPCAGVEGEELVPSSSPLEELEKKLINLEEASSPDDIPQFTKQRDLCADAELEGTAGWKLSNCLWNLQVIARSAGSLTRFMLDDIPGVTSPMVYIGMLFSWFAWHVEDHELHSLNFLHTGSPKTWYAIPGEHAFAFEDVIRKQAYGGDMDHLAALKILGEKTTLFSPEMVVASGIPCCRLVQNPGEFVVTFPRAYHLGFSHGFNCGEAANFGTPQWLTIAKEAAVRRAVMDHLPMLSHQQLLYLLTMSFVLRVPRTMLPGARSSRLRNRLKEERELMVKKAFIEDVLKENHLLNTLLGKESAFRAVLWHPDSLPSFARYSKVGTIVDAAPIKGVDMSVLPYKGVNEDNIPLTSHRKTPNALCLDSNGILCDFQVDSGTLVCVACGILGYPIMSVVQPSKKASMENLSAVKTNVSGVVDISRQPDSRHIQCSTKIFSPETNDDETWDTSGFMRPRIFCLEHAVKIEGLLRPKGGAKMLVICHSDYQKYKANAVAVAEELRTSFNYKEVRFDSVSQEELNLIDIAIDEKLNDFEDWTSKLGINLRFSVKTRKDSLPKKMEHALNIDYLLSIMAPDSRISYIKWGSRKSRTKQKSNCRTLATNCNGNLSKKDEIIHVTSSMESKGKILLQYSRRKYRTTTRTFTGAKHASECSLACPTGVTDADRGKVNDHSEDIPGTSCFKSLEKRFEVCGEVEAPALNRDPVINEALASASSVSNVLRISGETDNINEHLDAENCSSLIGSAGISSSARKEVGGEYGFMAKASGHAMLCIPEELNDDQITVNSFPDNSCNNLEVYATAANNAGESEPCKHGTTTVEVDMHILPKDNLTGNSQTGGCASSLLSLQEKQEIKLATAKMTSRDGSKRRRKVVLQTEAHKNFIKSPCEGLRPRKNRNDLVHTPDSNVAELKEEKPPTKKLKKSSGRASCNQVLDNKTSYRCSREGCQMTFRTKVDLSSHKNNKCHQRGCGKKFRSHKSVVLHQRVHDDERPLKCSWTGCTMTFKWAWARTEHMRLHTGERPYQCKIEGCGLTFRFVSDFSRHRRKFGHHVTPAS
ncbi:probable lysine-specific demethylase ELF6 isoform X2 [Chenopodium quinoa]|uniref:Lysine-specific demethylase ELF6 n=1 Tax=Chenopodium quinoa TaxID=63459 RepID=A0A803N0J9_CHEQI|nr:probable lysine-specific demethylase ELF6 isoform X2 [Chenopodium quinoa]